MANECFAPLNELAKTLPAYLRQVAQDQPPWQEHFGFDCVPIGNEWIEREPALRSLNRVHPIKQLGLLKVPAWTMYDWHIDAYRLSCVNMLISEDHHSHTLFGRQINDMNKSVQELQYKPDTYYLFNNQHKHCVINLDSDRHLLSLYFSQEIAYDRLLCLAQAADLVEVV